MVPSTYICTKAVSDFSRVHAKFSLIIMRQVCASSHTPRVLSVEEEVGGLSGIA